MSIPSLLYSHQIQIYQLLLVEVPSRDILQHIREQGGDVLAERHGHDGLLDSFFALVSILGDEARPQLKGLSLSRRRKGAPDAIYRHGCEAPAARRGSEDSESVEASRGCGITTASVAEVKKSGKSPAFELMSGELVTLGEIVGSRAVVMAASRTRVAWRFQLSGPFVRPSCQRATCGAAPQRWRYHLAAPSRLCLAFPGGAGHSRGLPKSIWLANDGDV